MIPKEMAPPVQGGARDCFGGWSRFADTLATAMAQPPAMPRLIALHLGAEALAVLAMGGQSHGYRAARHDFLASLGVGVLVIET